MSDQNLSLPIRTETNGDVAVKVVDGTLPSQALAVDSAGKVIVKLDDAAGVGLTSTLISGTKQSLDVNVANVSLNDSVSDVAATPPLKATYVAGSVTTAAPTYVTGQMDPLSLNTAGGLRVDGSGVTQPVSQVTSPWVVKDLADGSVSGGTAGAFSLLGGGQYNTALPTLTNGQQAAIQLDASGRAIIRPLTIADQVTAVQSGTWAQNITQVLGVAPSNTNALATQIATAGAYVGVGNPLPVVLYPSGGGTAVDDYKSAIAVAVSATDDHIYTVLGSVGLRVAQILVSASGKMKADVSAETGVGTGIYNIFATVFNSVATPSVVVPVVSGKLVPSGVRIKVTLTNLDNQAQNLYSTISGSTT